MGATAPRIAVPLAVVAALAVACAAALRHPTPQDAAVVEAQWPGTTVRDLDRGRALYVHRCAGCHALVLPKSQTPDDWPNYVEMMADRARLDPSQKADITRFLVALSGGAGSRGTKAPDPHPLPARHPVQ